MVFKLLFEEERLLCTKLLTYLQKEIYKYNLLHFNRIAFMYFNFHVSFFKPLKTWPRIYAERKMLPYKNTNAQTTMSEKQRKLNVASGEVNNERFIDIRKKINWMQERIY